jgi:branched-chain amino acid transport system ATP-binding protein
MTEPMLHVENLNVAYGDVQVLWDVTLDIFPGEMVALVGANGAGKTTLLGTLSGIIRARSGQIQFMGQHVGQHSAQELVDLGIAHVPEGRRLFNAMTVRDNLLMGAFRRRDRAQVNQDIDGILAMFPRLKERITSLAGKLSGGEQQMVAIGRALMAKPRLLLIDELSLGLAPVIIQQLVDTLVLINKQGTTLLVVEQDVQVALEIAHRGYVLETGHIVLTGHSQELLNDERVRKAYLGL